MSSPKSAAPPSFKARKNGDVGHGALEGASASHATTASGAKRRDLLEVIGVGKSLGGKGATALQILGDITFSVGRGEFVSVVGPSGCGKTTLLMCLAGLSAADHGRIAFEGCDVAAPPPGIAVVFQDYSRSLLPWRSNVGNVLFGMKRVTNMSRAEKEAAAREILGQVGLDGFEEHYPWQLSGGMQQRVAIARGIASQSRLLLLDEPLAAVDAQTRADMQDLLLSLASRYQQTCILVTHDVDEAIYMADRIVVLSRRPTHIVTELDVNLDKPRDQISTRAEREFLQLRQDVLRIIRRPAGKA